MTKTSCIVFCEYREFMYELSHVCLSSTIDHVWHTLKSIMDNKNVDRFIFDCIVLFKCA